MIEVEINNWEKYQPRKDVKVSIWFRLENNFLHDAHIFSLTSDQKIVWIFLLCEASKKMKSTITFNAALCAALLGIEESIVIDALDVIEKSELISITSRARNVDVTCAYAEKKLPEKICALQTNKQTNKQTGQTDREILSSEMPTTLSPQKVIELWNESNNNLPRCMKLSAARRNKLKAQLKRYPDLAHWELAMKAFNESRFIQEQWRPGIDDFLKEDKRLKALEGVYSKDFVSQQKTFSEIKTERNLKALREIELMEVDDEQ